MSDARRLEALRAEVAYRRQQRDLYRARTYGPRPTSPARMRELERLVADAEARLRHALAADGPSQPG